ncbi:MAG: exo-alpha-sialidase [Armatimonadota bacterium]|nr:MAG: exo-alpha-sialidase [Armatimonadota bacterium]
MRRVMTVAVLAALMLGLGAANAEVVLDPGAVTGVERFTHVRAVVADDQSVMAWLSAEPLQGGQVFAAGSTDEGAWSEPVQVSGGYPDWVASDGGAGEFSLVRASNGAYWLVWSADTGWRAQVGGAHGNSDSELTYAITSPDIWVSQSPDGRAWSIPEPVAIAPTPDRNPGIIEMPDGRVGVIWISARDGNADLSLAFADDAGTWGEAVQITTDPARDSQYELVHVGPKFVIDTRGRLTLAWVSELSGQPQVYSAVSADGRTWSRPVRVSGGPGDKGFLTIEEAGGGYNLYWSTATDEGEQRWASRSADFVTWGEPRLAPVGK